jgi:hypothetical protein
LGKRIITPRPSQFSYHADNAGKSHKANQQCVIADTHRVCGLTRENGKDHAFENERSPGKRLLRFCFPLRYTIYRMGANVLFH